MHSFFKMHLTSSLLLSHHCYCLGSGPYFLISVRGQHLSKLISSPRASLPDGSSKYLTLYPITYRPVPTHPIKKHFLSAGHRLNPLLCIRDIHINQIYKLFPQENQFEGENSKGAENYRKVWKVLWQGPGDCGSPEEHTEPSVEGRVKRSFPWPGFHLAAHLLKTLHCFHNLSPTFFFQSNIPWLS